MTISLRTLILPVLLAFFSPYLFMSSYAASLETKLLGTWFSLRGSAPVPRSVTLVRIDPRSMRRLGLAANQTLGFPELATVIEKIATAGAKLIVLDLYFSRVSKSADANIQIERALGRVPTVIARSIVPYVDTDLSGKQHIDLERSIPPSALTESASAVVPMMVTIGRDGVVSKISLDSLDSSVPLDQFPLLDPLRQFVSPSVEAPSAHDLINYYGPPYAIPDVPIYKLLLPEESVAPEYFRDRVVLIGGVDTPNGNLDGRDDSFMTPASNRPMYGVEIHATIVQNLLDKTWIKRFSRLQEAGVQTLFISFYSVLLIAVGLYRGFIVTVGLTVAWALASYLCFTSLNVFIPGATLCGVVVPSLVASFAIWEAMKASGPHNATR